MSRGVENRIATAWPSDDEYGRSPLLTNWTPQPRKVIGEAGRQLAYVEQGVGAETTVLLHGLGNSWEIWLPLIGSLSQDTRVVAVDLPGFGRSDSPSGGLTIEAIAERLEESWPVLGLGRSRVVGHSLGGLVACALASRGRVPVSSIAVIDGTLVTPVALGSLDLMVLLREPLFALRALLLGALVSPPVPRPLRSFIVSQDTLAKVLLSLCLRDPKRIDRRLLAAVLNGLGRTIAPQRFRGLFALDFQRLLSDVKVPTLLVHGSEDRVVSRDDFEHVVGEIDRAEGLVVHGGAHWVVLEYPEVVLDALRGFFDRSV
jgi:pimeloyl-ACP methyl ester carboxylesterase